MNRSVEAAIVAAFAAVVAVPAAALFVSIAIGQQSAGTHVGFLAALVSTGVAVAFVAAWLMRRRSNLETYGSGVRLGLWSAFGFYLIWIVIFAAIPALAAASEGHFTKAASYFLEFVWIALSISRGVPVIVGVAGGVAYIFLKKSVIAGMRPK